MSSEELALEALDENGKEKKIEKVEFPNYVETWTLDKEQNPEVVDKLGYIPREKIIARGIANGELLNEFRRSPEFMRQFSDTSNDESLPVMPDISTMDSLEVEDIIQNTNQHISELSERIKTSQMQIKEIKVEPEEPVKEDVKASEEK